jgi:hypothetical protein
MLNPQESAGNAGPTNTTIDPSKMDPELLRKLVEAACQGKLGPQAKQMADAAQQGGGQASAQDGSQPPQDGQSAPPPQPGRMMASKHIFGRPGAAPPQDNDDDDQYSQQQAPMGARGIFGR